MTAEPPDHVGEAVERLAEMHRQHQDRSTPAQRLEEQRAENPLLGSRVDSEAEQMARAADPRETLARIEAARPAER